MHECAVRDVDPEVRADQIRDLAVGHAVAVLQVGRQPEHVGPERDPRCAARGRHLIRMLAANPPPALLAVAALRNDAAHVSADLRQIDDKLLVIGDVIDCAAATRAALEGLEDLLIDVVGDGLARTQVSSLAAWLAAMLQTNPSGEGSRLPLPGPQRLRQLSHEILDLLLELLLLLEQLIELALEPHVARSLRLQEAFEFSS